MMKRRRCSTLICLLVGLLVATTVAQGAVKVICVPWQGNPSKYHTAVSGQQVELKAVVKTSGTGTVYYRWDFGDGSAPYNSTLSGSTKYNVARMHTYTGSVGTPFTAQLLVDEVDASMSNAVVDNFLVKIETDDLDAKVNRAIDRGLWYLYKDVDFHGSPTGYYHSLNGEEVAVWWYGSYSTSPTASAIHAFQINGHKKDGDPNEDPYVEVVKKGLNWLFNGWYRYSGRYMLRTYSIGMQPGGDPDSRPNGKGIGVYDYSTGRPVYQGGMVMDAIIASGDPNADTERDFDGDGNTENYREVLQDMTDMYAWGQDDYGADAGGWRYSWNSDSDNSACQWAAIGMLPAQAPPWNCTVPQWVKNWNNGWLNYSHYQWNWDGTQYIWGGFGYSGSGWGRATTPSGMVQLDFVGATTSDPRWIRCERWFADNWKDTGYDWLDRNFMYAYYSLAKAMRLALPNPVETFSSNGFDWYRGSTTKMGMAEKISNTLVANGRWGGYGYTLDTAWAVIILKPVLFAAAPIACFDADPNPSYSDMPIYFDPTCSGHSEPGKDISNLVLYQWDWDNDGTYDEWTTEPNVVAHSFHVDLADIPKSSWVVLKVTDDVGGTATSAKRIDITNPPHPPVAQVMGPYMVSLCRGDTLILDGSGSYDPDEGEHEAGCPTCPDDTIIAWEWDLTGAPWDYTDATGEVLNLGTGFTTYFPTAGLYDIGLRVTDNTAAAYPSSGEPNLTDEAFQKVEVYNGCICDFNAVVMCDYVILSWDDIGAETYEVYRSFAGANYGFQFMKSVATNSTALGSFVMEKDHWYRIMAVFQDGSKCLSKAKYVYGNKEVCNPTADADGPYQACVGETITLDGSGSSPQMGVILEWLWDLDNDGQYDDASGETVQASWNTPGIHTIGLRVKSSDAFTLWDVDSTTVDVQLCLITVDIDIYPNRVPNRVYLSRNYTLYVAVLGSDTFDVTNINSSTIKFGKTGTEASPVRAPLLRDLNRDGKVDAMYGFMTFSSGFGLGDTQGILTGKLNDGTDIKGTDSVLVLN